MDSATPHSDPSGGQAPALHFLVPPSIIGLQFGRFRRWSAGIEVDWRAHPGSESGMCFRSNRSCRQGPAHGGMKSRSCGLVRRIGTVGSATPHPDPSGGQAPASLHSTSLHFLRHRPSVYNSAGSPVESGIVVWYGIDVVDSANAPCRNERSGQAPRLGSLRPSPTFSRSASSIIGLQFGTVSPSCA